MRNSHLDEPIERSKEMSPTKHLRNGQRHAGRQYEAGYYRWQLLFWLVKIQNVVTYDLCCIHSPGIVFFWFPSSIKAKAFLPSNWGDLLADPLCEGIECDREGEMAFRTKIQPH